MHAALRKVLGTHVTQKGSLVDPDRTRFDFSHPQPLTDEEIRTVEALVNRAIRANYPVEARHHALRRGRSSPAPWRCSARSTATQVRVLTMGDFSTELCGGTHVERTGDIGLFKIVSESGVAAGIRRVEAVTAEGALAYTHETEARLHEAARALKAPAAEVPAKIAHVLDSMRALEKELARLKGRLASSQGGDLAAQAVNVNGAQVLATTIEGADAKVLRETLDQLKGRLKSAAIVLGSTEGGKVTLIAGVTSDLTDRIKAGELVNHVATQVGGKGGGRPDMAQAGGTNPAGLAAALQSVPTWVAAAPVVARHDRTLTPMPLRAEATLDRSSHRGEGYLPGLIGVRFTAVAEGRIEAELAIRPELLAPNGYLHAATVIALADTACGYGCLAHLPAGAENFTTVELKTNFLGTVRDGTIACVATPMHLGNTHPSLGRCGHRPRHRAPARALPLHPARPLARARLARCLARGVRTQRAHDGLTVCSSAITSNRAALRAGRVAPYDRAWLTAYKAVERIGGEAVSAVLRARQSSARKGHEWKGRQGDECNTLSAVVA